MWINGNQMGKCLEFRRPSHEFVSFSGKTITTIVTTSVIGIQVERDGTDEKLRCEFGYPTSFFHSRSLYYDVIFFAIGGDFFFPYIFGLFSDTLVVVFNCQDVIVTF